MFWIDKGKKNILGGSSTYIILYILLPIELEFPKYINFNEIKSTMKFKISVDYYLNFNNGKKKASNCVSTTSIYKTIPYNKRNWAGIFYNTKSLVKLDVTTKSINK